MTDSPAISVQNIGKVYRIWESPSARLTTPLQAGFSKLLPDQWAASRWLKARAAGNYRDFHALHDISIEVGRGESVGVIGLNGSGKSTLLQIIAGILKPTSGNAVVNGRVAALLELGSGFNPEFTGRENVFLNGAVLGLTHRELEERFDTIVDFADIGNFLDQPVKTYSSGMFVRLAFAVATHVSANVLLIDEALTVGDIFFQQKCYAHLNQLKDQGVAVVLVTHGMNDVEQFCNRAYLLHHGEIQAAGPSPEVVKHYYLLNRGSTTMTTVVPETAPTAAHPGWPAAEAHLNLHSVRQVTDGAMRCVSVAICNASGLPCRRFEQGEKIVLYYAFEVLRPIEIPVVGIVLFNNKGIIAHGKSSLEYGCKFPSGFSAGRKLRFRHEITLELAPGEYTFEVGCASISPATMQRAAELSHFQLSEQVQRHCHLPGLGPIEIAFRRQGRPVQLLHHGIANLPGEIEWLGDLPAS